MPATGGIKQLHELHQQLAWHAKQLEDGPRKVRVRIKFVEKKQAELAAHKDQLTQLQKTADETNLQFRSNEEQIAELKVKLNKASSNKEFEIIKGQMDGDISANETLEDEYLELLEQIDTGRSEFAKLGEQLEAAQADVEAMKKELAEEEPKLRVGITTVENELPEASECLPSKLQEMYRRLVTAYGPEAFAPVENDACSECFVQFSPQQSVELRNGTVLLCRECGRLVYLDAAE
jgi:predicted  nucleic acid-binding Zn-ribbon protein